MVTQEWVKSLTDQELGQAYYEMLEDQSYEDAKELALEAKLRGMIL